MLKTLHIKNFTVFPDAELQFSPGLNVIIGENGTGKSHLLKLGYAILKTLESFGDKAPAKEVAEREFARNLVDIFRPESLGRLASRVQGSAGSSVGAEWGRNGKLGFYFSTRKSEKVDLWSSPQYESLRSSTLFIPPKEILSVFEGFQGALEKRELAFDGTYLALAKALNPPPLKGKRPVDTAKLVESLEKVLHASVVKRGNRFYFLPKSTAGQFEAPLAAEGHRKLGMLAYLILNGELRNKSSLFWDEPEANLNPRLLVKLAQILVELSKVMQVTIATHSLFLLRELEIFQEEKKLSEARYFGLQLTDNGVEVRHGKSSNDIGEIAALDASIEQADRYLQADGEM
ncbi:AAA family ATPase [Desulfovibrio sp. ZJ369]|uniref:AAA family ATPase n=1 Tax=Desulfovibrio sp. ZJ369 TaxID=2709793 RepID=UPI0013EDB3E5|nr:AAA family ATPase [Desulfovibrio sp. ZJ369]